jgi:hypothetical protein
MTESKTAIFLSYASQDAEAGGELGAGQSKVSTGYGVFVIRCTDYAVAVTYFPWGF